MDEQVRQKLCEIVAGKELSHLKTEPSRYEALLRDHCGKSKQDINLLVTALRANLIPDPKAGGNMPREMRLRQLARSLEGYHFTESAALWGVESWARALGVLKPGDPPLAPSEAREVKSENGAGSHTSNGAAAAAHVVPDTASVGGEALVAPKERPRSVYVLWSIVAVLFVASSVLTVLKVQADGKIKDLNVSLSKAQSDLSSARSDFDTKLKAERAARDAALRDRDSQIQQAKSFNASASIEEVSHSNNVYDYYSSSEGVRFTVKLKASNLQSTQCFLYAYFYNVDGTQLLSGGSPAYVYTSFTPNSREYEYPYTVFVPYSTVDSRTTDYHVQFVIKRAGQELVKSDLYEF